MLTHFIMNGYMWNVRFTEPTDPILIDRTNSWTLAVTDPETMTIYISDELSGDLLTKVTLHELAHAMMYSYDYLPIIHQYCKKRFWIDAEEMIANLIADRAQEIFKRAYEIVGDEAIHFVPYGLEQYVA